MQKVKPCPRCGKQPEVVTYWKDDPHESKVYICKTGCDNFHEYDLAGWDKRPLERESVEEGKK